MQTQLDTCAIIGILGALQGVLLSAALWNAPKGDKRAARLLSGLMAVFSLNMAGSLLFYTRYIWFVPHLAHAHTPLAFLMMPLFYGYAKMQMKPGAKIKTAHLLHLLPFVFCVLYLSPLYCQNTASKLAYLAEQYRTVAPWRRWLAGTMLLSGFVYLLRVLWSLNRIKALHPQLRVLRIFCGLLASLLLLAAVRLFFNYGYHTSSWVPAAFSILIYALGYAALKQPEAVYGQIAPRYAGSALDGARADDCRRRLENWMEQQKPFLNPDLSLAGLAEQLQWSPHLLSQVINEQFGCHFFDFINTYRVHEFQRRLSDPAGKLYTMTALAEQAGFHSKSSFNAAFKKHTRLTPSAYKKRFEKQAAAS
jgi:AraC-like DNA-binding protein